MQITGGRVVYSRTVQPAQFESKRAEVELTFVLSENEPLDGALQQVASLAETQALRMVRQIEAQSPHRRGDDDESERPRLRRR